MIACLMPIKTTRCKVIGCHATLQPFASKMTRLRFSISGKSLSLSTPITPFTSTTAMIASRRCPFSTCPRHHRSRGSRCNCGASDSTTAPNDQDGPVPVRRQWAMPWACWLHTVHVPSNRQCISFSALIGNGKFIPRVRAKLRPKLVRLASTWSWKKPVTYKVHK